MALRGQCDGRRGGEGQLGVSVRPDPGHHQADRCDQRRHERHLSARGGHRPAAANPPTTRPPRAPLPPRRAQRRPAPPPTDGAWRPRRTRLRTPRRPRPAPASRPTRGRSWPTGACRSRRSPWATRGCARADGRGRRPGSGDRPRTPQPSSPCTNRTPPAPPHPPGPLSPTPPPPRRAPRRPRGPAPAPRRWPPRPLRRTPAPAPSAAPRRPCRRRASTPPAARAHRPGRPGPGSRRRTPARRPACAPQHAGSAMHFAPGASTVPPPTVWRTDAADARSPAPGSGAGGQVLPCRVDPGRRAEVGGHRAVRG